MTLHYKNIYDKIIIINFNILKNFSSEKIINRINDLLNIKIMKKLYFLEDESKNFTEHFIFGNLNDMLIFHSHLNINLNLILKKYIEKDININTFFINENNRFFSKKYKDNHDNKNNNNDKIKKEKIEPIDNNNKKNDDNEFDIEKFFKNYHNEPNAINLHIKCESLSNFHDVIFKIFVNGLIIHYGDINNNSIDISDIDDNKVNKISNYMLSIGIKVYFKKYDKIEIDNIIRNFLYEIKNFDCKINVNIDWKTDIIENVSINIDPHKLMVKDQIEKSLEKHYESNFFLNMREKKFLKDYVIFFEKDNIKHGIYFDIYDRIKNSNNYNILYF